MKKANLLQLLGAVLLLNACSKDAEPETIINKSVVIINYDTEHQFTITKGEESVPIDLIKWTSSDPKVAQISANGTLKGRKIGPTLVKGIYNGREFLSWVTVKPYSTIYKEPDFLFGSDKSTVKFKVLGLLKEEGESVLVYFGGGSSKVKQEVYLFQDNLLLAIVLDFEDSESVKKEVETFYKERYPLIISPDKTHPFFATDDLSMAIRLDSSESIGFYVSYTKILNGGRLSADIERDRVEQALLPTICSGNKSDILRREL